MIEYIKDDVFIKLTRKQKLQLNPVCDFGEVEINRLVVIPTSEKLGGDYKLGHFFAYTNGKGWWKPTVYDCWRVVTDIENPARLRYSILQGDFENGGLQIFKFVDEFHKAFISYGGEIIIRRKS